MTQKTRQNWETPIQYTRQILAALKGHQNLELQCTPCKKLNYNKEYKITIEYSIVQIN